MINNRMNEGVGKKIVEALKKQNDIEIIPVAENEPLEDYSQEENFSVNSATDLSEDETLNMNFDDESFDDETSVQQPAAQQNFPAQNFTNPLFEEIPATMNFTQQHASPPQNSAINSTVNFSKDIDDFEMPNNITVLKQLILQLPSGVTKQTGALIIRQTMEALGISMKSVLQDAQQVQENINSSSRECQANIMEYKRQIVLMENKVQKYSKQYAALNDIISLFIQTGN